MKWIKKYKFKIVSVVLICFLSVFFIFNNKNNISILSKENEQTKIYTVYHVETFEGGSKSRINYLKNIARAIEKQNPNILFMIKQIAPEKLKTELSETNFDIISFGYGVGEVVLPFLVNLDKTYNLRDEVLNSGMFNNKLYALPYILSGYCKIIQDEENQNFYCGTNNYINSQNICPNPIKKQSQYEAYKDFVYNKNSNLVGTARDLFRVDNLNKTGRTNATFSFIETYTDLVQYLGVTKTDEITLKFLQMSVDSKFQNQLSDYGLFSVTDNNLYFDGIYNSMENAIKNCIIGNVFND